tara:strand:- start:4794 stop:5168 length:375 start_codon:yes stop_codon:yes gene_type:complete
MPTYKTAVAASGSAFPVSVECDYPHKAMVDFVNVISTSYSGKEKRASKVPARFTFVLRFEQLTHADGDTLWNHYRAQLGTLSSFNYTDYNSGEIFSVRYADQSLTRDSFIFDAEKIGITLIEVL